MSASPHKLILASAGTGKTYQLTNQLLGLLFAGVEPERILATTFTRKAAGEIMDRVMLRLVEATEQPDKLNELAEALDHADVSAERCLNLLSKLTRSLDGFQVRTIDSFFVHLVKLFALDLELPPNWGIASMAQDVALQAEAMQDVLEQLPDNEAIRILRALDSGSIGRGVHDRMLEHAANMRPVFLESAAGAWDRVQPGTGPSDQEFAAALDAVRTAELPTTAKGKPHKAWVKAVNKVVEAATLQQLDQILTQGLGKAFLSPGQTYFRTPFPESLLTALAPVVGRAVFEYLAKLSRRNLATHDLLERFEAAYAKRKRERGAYRFDDLPLSLSPRAASELAIDARELDMWFRLDSRIDHLLLDEFQDTSPLQWRILHNIASEIAADGTGERTFFCVGDVKQSIYGFRQAEPRLLAGLETLLPGLEARYIHKSYRSSSVVLETVNFVFTDVEHNATLEGEDLEPYLTGAREWQRGFDTHVAAKELTGATFLIEARDREEGEPKAMPLLERTIARVTQITHDAPGASVGILMRERKHIAWLIHQLRKQGIDASGEGGNELTDSVAVLAFLSLLHLADHPDDSAAAFHVASSRFGEQLGISKEATPEQRHDLARHVRSRLTQEGLGAFCAGMAKQVTAAVGWSPWDEARFSQLSELAYGFESRAGLRPSDFVDHVRSERVESPGGAPVRVMTIHGAKGLEFDAVILPEIGKRFIGTRSGLLVDRPRPDGPFESVSISPAKAYLVTDEALKANYDQATARMFEGGLCLLYVAMTRAKHRLDLIVPYVDPEKKTSAKPSMAGFIRAALPQDEIHEPDSGGVIWSHTDNAQGDAWAPVTEQTADDIAAVSPADPSLGLKASTHPRLLPRHSPSAQASGKPVKVTSLLDDRQGARRGTLAHQLLEKLEWIEDFDLDASEFKEALANPSIRSVLSREGCGAPADATLEVRNEHAFSVVLNDEHGEEQLWTGYIDRLVIGSRGNDIVFAQVIDYKTDHISESQLAERTQHYRPQLETYGRVVAAQTGLPLNTIQLRLLFLHPGRIVDL